MEHLFRSGISHPAPMQVMRLVLPETFPGYVVHALESLGYDVLLSSETGLGDLCRISGSERRILIVQKELLPKYGARPGKAHGIVALGATTQTAEGFEKFVLPHLRETAEAEFQGRITFIRGTGAAEVVRIRHANQRVQERISIPRGTNEQFLHNATHGYSELRTKGVPLGGFTRTLKGYSVERHLTGYHFLGLVINGRLDFLSDRSNARALDKGCTFLIPGGIHCAYKANSPTEFLWLQLDPGAFGQNITGDIKSGYIIHHYELMDYCRQFHEEARTPNVNREVACSHLASLIKLSVERNVLALGIDPQFDESRERLNQALRTFEEKLSASLTVGDLARLAGVSTPQLYRNTHRYFEKSPGTLIEEIRIRHAKELLRHTEYNLGKIAEMTGYSDAFSFSRAFKRLTGTAPREFRKRLTHTA